jgi:hypothetical protein
LQRLKERKEALLRSKGFSLTEESHEPIHSQQLSLGSTTSLTQQPLNFDARLNTLTSHGASHFDPRSLPTHHSRESM